MFRKFNEGHGKKNFSELREDIELIRNWGVGAPVLVLLPGLIIVWFYDSTIIQGHFFPYVSLILLIYSLLVMFLLWCKARELVNIDCSKQQRQKSGKYCGSVLANTGYLFTLIGASMSILNLVFSAGDGYQSINHMLLSIAISLTTSIIGFWAGHNLHFSSVGWDEEKTVPGHKGEESGVVVGHSKNTEEPIAVPEDEPPGQTDNVPNPDCPSGQGNVREKDNIDPKSTEHVRCYWLHDLVDKAKVLKEITVPQDAMDKTKSLLSELEEMISTLSYNITEMNTDCSLQRKIKSELMPVTQSVKNSIDKPEKNNSQFRSELFEWLDRIHHQFNPPDN